MAKFYVNFVFFTGLLVIAAFGGCKTERTAGRILESNGYKNVTFCGTNFLSCGSGDWYRTCFRAENDGRKVEGTVCEGLIFKGSTIRFD